ncbi:unnamed protein product [Victoria cruziana]
MDVIGSRYLIEMLNPLPTVVEPSVGSFYERYLQKRDAKIREESAETRAQKREKMKAMMECLENDSAEMKARFLRSAGKREATSQGCKEKEKPVEDKVQAASRPGDQSGDVSEIKVESSEKSENDFRRISPCKSVPVNAYLKMSQGKKPLHKRSLSLTNPSTAGSSAKVSSNTHMGKRGNQSENSPGQSPSFFSDFREDNSMPSKATIAGSARPQVSKFARSMSIGEEIFLSKDDKPRQSQFKKKTPRVMGR